GARRGGTRSRSGSSRGAGARRPGSLPAAVRTGPGPTAAGTSGEFFPQRPHVVRGAGQGDAGLDVAQAAAGLRLGAGRIQRALPDPQAQRAADQLGVGELRAAARLAVVVEDLQVARLE